MKDTVLEYLEKGGPCRDVDLELADLGLTRRTLNDPVNRQRVITGLEIRFPNWRAEQAEAAAR